MDICLICGGNKCAPKERAIAEQMLKNAGGYYREEVKATSSTIYMNNGKKIELRGTCENCDCLAITKFLKENNQ